MTPRATKSRPDALREEALAFARAAHGDQRRDTDGAPYVQHPLDVARLLEEAGFSEQVVAAALLHDVLEKTEVTPREVEARFGSEVARLVSALTEDESLDVYEERKAAHRERIADSEPDAAAIFLADKVAKARDLSSALQREGAGAEERLTAAVRAKLDHYERTIEVLERSHPDQELLAELRRAVDLLKAEARGALH